MIKFENTEVVGYEHAIRGMRNPLESWKKSDSYFETCRDGCQMPIDCCNCNDGLFIGKNDLDLMKRLRNAGTDHRKFMRMITVYVDITAPLYWWKEFDTYKVGTVANSCSTMHCIHKKEFTLEDFSCEHLINEEDYACYGCEYITPYSNLEITISSLNGLRESYLETVEKLKNKDLTEQERKHFTRKKKRVWYSMIQLLPSSYNQKRTVMMNYEVLANIYKSRKNHKLDEWSIGFMEWIDGLPYSELITGEFDSNKNDNVYVCKIINNKNVKLEMIHDLKTRQYIKMMANSVKGCYINFDNTKYYCDINNDVVAKVIE